MELFSVIIPVYNVENYLDRCVESVCRQIYQNFEIILVDDGATDNSGKMCDEWAKKDSRIKVIHQANKGLPGARNSGLKIATGDFIFFLDSYDFIEKEFLFKTLNYMRRGYDICSFCARRVDEEGKYIYDMRFPEGIGEQRFTEQNREIFILNTLLQYKVGWEACFGVFRRDFLSINNIFFYEDVKFAEDMLFTFECMLKVGNYIKIPDILYDYTQRNSSIMGKTSEEESLKNVLESVFSKINLVLQDYKSRHFSVSIYYVMLMFFYYHGLNKKYRYDEVLKILRNVNKGLGMGYIKDAIDNKKYMVELMGKDEADVYIKFLEKVIV